MEVIAPNNSTENLSEPDYQGRKKVAWLVFSALGLGLIAAILYYFLVYRFYQSTENAYVKADLTWIMPRVPGEVLQLNIQDNQYVNKGQALLKIDNRDFQARADQAQAMLNLKQAGLSVQAQNENAARSSVVEAVSAKAAAQADLNRLQADYQRHLQLFKEGVVTRQRYEGVQAQYFTAQAQLAKAQATIDAAKAQLASLQATRAQIGADLDSAKAQVRLSAVDLNAAQIVAPVAGRVGSLAVRVGARVGPQTRLLAIIPDNSLFVEANFKETQIEKMRLGQHVLLKLDAYPSLKFKGTIKSFAPASGATFSLMPPDNATGNFNKVVQRIAVRIALPKQAHLELVKPGMSVVAKVDLRS